jgi:hypothetical protein
MEVRLALVLTRPAGQLYITKGYRRDLAGGPAPRNGIINGVDDAAKAVRQHYKDGDDAIKIMPSGGVLDEGMNGEKPQMTLQESRLWSKRRTTMAQ